MALRNSLWLKGTLYERLDEYRAALTAAQEQAVARMLLVYAQTQQATMRQFEDLAAQVQRDIAAGKPFTADRLRRMQRYTDLMNATEQRVKDFGEYASEETRRLQIASIRAAEARAQALMEAALADDLVLYPDKIGRGALPPGVTLADIRKQFGTLPSGLLDDLAGIVGDGTPLREYFLRGTANVPPLSLSVVKGLEEALVAGVGQGLNPRVVGRQVSNALGIGLDRALTIARTEANRAARLATHASYEANSDVIVGWRWVASLGPRTCAACVAMDGTIHPLTETLNDHPNGACQPAPVTRVAQEIGHESWRRVKDEEGNYEVVKGETGATWFERQTPAQQERTLGKPGYAAWKAGKVKLNDFIGEQRSDTFGQSIVQNSLKRMLGTETAQRFYQGGENAGNVA